MTYKEIQETYRRNFGKTIKTCWIADVKRRMGYKVREAYNRQGVTIINGCPPNIVDSIGQILVGQIQ